ncbi:bifunctional DNA primase/polymerase [Streptococcus hyovaginalis]
MEERLRTNRVTALAFLKKGYQVIPLNRKTGQPIIKFKNVDMTEEIINSINWSNCDVALLMRGMWCIDIDTHNMDHKLAQEMKVMFQLMGVGLFDILKTDRFNRGLDGYSSILLSEYRGELIENFKRTYVELTDSGGMHIIFKKRNEVDYSQKIGVMPGVDIKANDNNYVKIFPSDGREVLQKVDGLAPYVGEFEKQIFAKPVVTHYFAGSVIKPKNDNHEGSQAYERVVSGSSINRNDDLFKAACWAFERDQVIDDLSVIVGTVKGRDVFTLEEFERTIESARRTVFG